MMNIQSTYNQGQAKDQDKYSSIKSRPMKLDKQQQPDFSDISFAYKTQKSNLGLEQGFQGTNDLLLMF